MGQTTNGGTASWVPDSCTLPTVQVPLRLAEFDGFLGACARTVDRVDEHTLRIALDADAQVAARAADLATRESSCCSFFTFTVTATGGDLALTIQVPDGYVPVLDALASRATAVMRA